jgi:urea transporter
MATRFAPKLRGALRTLFLSYSQILFAESELAGALVLLASCVDLRLGASGLLGCALVNGTAWGIGLDRGLIRRGLLGYNGVLLGLALGALYSIDASLIALLCLSAILLVLVSSGLSYALGYYFRLPTLSIPFTLVTWAAILASLNLGYLRPAPLTQPLIALTDPFFSRISAIVFQHNLVSGVLIFAAIALYSGVALVLVCVGIGAASAVHGFLGLDPSVAEGVAFAFSAMFSALAVGGVFCVPGPGSTVLAAIAAALSVLVLSACHAVLPGYISPLTLPYCVTVLLIILALRLRVVSSLGISLVAQDPLRPEANLKRHCEQARQTPLGTARVSLPFSGHWRITQGIGGTHTHQGIYRFAYDFQAAGAGGEIFHGSGLALEDYHSYGKPVLAPADGIVTTLENEIEDNPPGAVNIAKNWGNHIILEHAPAWYSCLAHLKRGSVRVAQGQRVKRGQVIGLCGNSGRSPYPHLHLQFQYSPIPGAPAQPFRFSDVWVVQKSGKPQYVRSGELSENWIVSNLPLRSDARELFPCYVDRNWVLSSTEVWTLSVAPNGQMRLDSAPDGASLDFWFLDGIVSVVGSEGPRTSALGVLGTVLSDLPMAASPMRLRWSTLIRRGERWPIAALFGIWLETEIDYELESLPDGIRLSAVRRPAVVILGWKRRMRALSPVEMQFSLGQAIELQESGSRVRSLQIPQPV